MAFFRYFVVTLLVTFFYSQALAAMSSEQQRYRKSTYYSGNNFATKPVVTKRSGSENLVIPKEYLDNLSGYFGESNVSKTFPTTSMSVNYDEVWESKIIDGLSKSQIRNNSSSLNKIRSYWKDGKIQGTAVLKKMKYGGKSKYYITEIKSRSEALSKM